MSISGVEAKCSSIYLPAPEESAKNLEPPSTGTAKHGGDEKAIQQEKLREIESNGVSYDAEGLPSFRDPQDRANPLIWSYTYRMSIVALISIMTTIDVFATIMFLPAVPALLHDFASNDYTYSIILVSIWEIGEGLGPFYIAPLSEIYGRLPIYYSTNILFIVFAVASALSTSLGMLVAFRLLNGLVCSSLTLGPAIVGDMFKQEERGSTMALLYIGPLVGPVTAPIIGGFLAKAKGWRWTFWLIAIAVAAVQIPTFLCMRETYRPQILRKRIVELQQLNYDAHSKRGVFKRAIIRPIRFLLFSPVVSSLSFFTAVGYGLQYLIMTTLAHLFQTSYGFSESSTGLTYLGLAIGMVLGVVLCGLVSDRYIKSKGNFAQPEHRLPLAILGNAVIPIGFFLYGWTAQYKVLYIVPLLGTSLIGFGLMTTVIPVENYLVDAYTLHGASAVAATTPLKSFSGAVLPLAAPALYARLGLGWGNSLLGFIALAIIPLPILLMRYGKWARDRWQVEV